MKGSVDKIVLAYSGGLDTSVILAWLRETYDAEVIAFCADVGQAEELDDVPDKARAGGAVDCIVRDLREEFVRDYCFPMLRANALYEGEYLLGTSIARPIIAKAMMEVAEECGADAISHGATGKGNDQVRFELTALAIDPQRAENGALQFFPASHKMGYLGLSDGGTIMNGGGKTIQCGICHGADLQGIGDVPPITGRSPIGTVRQLINMQNGSRNGPGAAMMKPVVDPLSLDDIISIAAYTSSR